MDTSNTKSTRQGSIPLAIVLGLVVSASICGLGAFKALCSPSKPTVDATQVKSDQSQDHILTSVATDTSSSIVLQPIESLQVGQRVRADSPTDEVDLQFGSEVIPSEWRKLTLTAPKRDGTVSEVVLLRPLLWVTEQQAEVNGKVYISVPECGIDGNATVSRIEACPDIIHGPGRVITGTFRHQVVGGIELSIADESEPIRCTGNHPIWSETRHDFVRADSLQPGEKLRTASRVTAFVDAKQLPSQTFVYNIEVHGLHVYHVGESGLLVHNGDETACSKLLGEALEAIGDKRPPGTITRKDGKVIAAYEAAHIVPGGDFSTHGYEVMRILDDARDALNAAGIKINDHRNGFWARKGHRGTHTLEYFEQLGKLINTDVPTDQIEDNLHRLWDMIRLGDFL